MAEPVRSPETGVALLRRNTPPIQSCSTLSSIVLPEWIQNPLNKLIGIDGEPGGEPCHVEKDARSPKRSLEYEFEWATSSAASETFLLRSPNHSSMLVPSSHERTPIDEAVSRGKMEIVDTVNAAVVQGELQGVGVH
ncbi:hypothetical protein KSP40_PGU015571 [Platanthera guangdongensis]|uniref:Uncharacterized protein n=1 Tax=Platanthera guangdongensis TaxID=2320717 RepID=A0ABR2LZ15_9ASPA